MFVGVINTELITRRPHTILGAEDQLQVWWQGYFAKTMDTIVSRASLVLGDASLRVY